MSTLATNPSYVRPAALSRGARVWGYELFATAAIAIVTITITAEQVPLRAVAAWWVTATVALAINQARTLVAHGYVHTGERLTLAQQVRDSSTVLGPPWWTGLVHPLGTQHHALHHLAPSLPYHALAAAHQRLVGRGVDATYRDTETAGFIRALAQAWRRAHAVSRRRRDRSAHTSQAAVTSHHP